MAGTVPVALTPGLPHGEIRFFSLGDVPFRSGQRGPNQSPMYRPLIIRPLVVCLVGLGRIDVNGFTSSGREDGVVVRRRRQRLDIAGPVVGKRLVDDDRVRVGGADTRILRNILRQRARLLAPGGRGFRLLVLVLGVTRRAPRLPDVVIDHRNDEVIGDATLARTVVVQNVTEPKPALLH